MLKLEAEISAGQLSSPPADNALTTVEHILALVFDATPSDLDAIKAMSSRFDQRASEARARQDNEAAERFSTLRDALALGGSPGNPRPQSAPAPATASPASTSNRLTIVGAAEPTTETKAGSNTGLPGRAAIGDTNRSDGLPPRTESQTASELAGPKPAQLAQGLHEPDQEEAGGNPEPPPLHNTAPISQPMITVLLRRGAEKLAQGDISAARLLFERAAGAGSAAGATGLAKTYDPVFLTKLGAIGTQADPGLASKWYSQARRLERNEAARAGQPVSASGSPSPAALVTPYP